MTLQTSTGNRVRRLTPDRPETLVWKVCELDELLDTPLEHAERLAAQPVSSLIAVERCMTALAWEQVATARQRENDGFAELMGGPANTEALTAFAEDRKPAFTTLPSGW